MLAGIFLSLVLELFEMQLPENLLRELIEIGLAVLVFTAGSELSPRRMRGRIRQIVIVATLQFLCWGWRAGLLRCGWGMSG